MFDLIAIIFVFIIFPILLHVGLLVISSIINYVPSWYIAKWVSSYSTKIRKPIFLTIFLLMSSVIFLNVRLPGIVYDGYHNFKSVKVIYRPITAYIAEPIVVSVNEHVVRSKKSYLSSLYIGGNTGSGFPHIIHPRVVGDDFVKELKLQGLSIRKGDSPGARIKIAGHIEKTPTHDEFDIVIFEGDDKVAEYSGVYRTAFISDRLDNTFLESIVLLFQSSLTSLPFMEGFSEYRFGKKPMSEFLAEAIRVSPMPDMMAVGELESPEIYVEDVNDLIEKLKVGKQHHINNNIFNKNNCTRGGLPNEVRFGVRRADRISSNDYSQGNLGHVASRLLILGDQEKGLLRISIQPPGAKKYVDSITHKIECSKEYIELVMSFSGVDMSIPEWHEMIRRNLSKKGINPSKNVKYIKNIPSYHNSYHNAEVRARQLHDHRNIWRFRYSYDGVLLDASKGELVKVTEAAKRYRSELDGWIEAELGGL